MKTLVCYPSTILALIQVCRLPCAKEIFESWGEQVWENPGCELVQVQAQGGDQIPRDEASFGSDGILQSWGC